MTEVAHTPRNPWRNLQDRADRLTLLPTRTARISILTLGVMLGVTIAGALTVDGPPLLIAGVLASLISAAFFTYVTYNLPTYEFEKLKNSALSTGHILVTEDSSSLLGSGHIISAVFKHFGDQELLVGLSNGDSKIVDLRGESTIAYPNDLFDKHRALQLPHRSKIQDPDIQIIQLLIAIWDQRLFHDTFEVATETVTSYLESLLPADDQIDEVDHFQAPLLRATEQNLITLQVKGRKNHATQYVGLTGLGNVVVACFLREHGLEPYAESGKENPIMVENNFGNIFTNSPGAAGVVGTGNATGGPESSVAQSIAALIREKQKIISQINDLEIQETVTQAIDDIEHELDHPNCDDKRIQKHLRTINQLAGSLVISVIGSATWSAISNWIA